MTHSIEINLGATTDALITGRTTAIKLFVSEAAVLRAANRSASLGGEMLGSLLATGSIFTDSVTQAYVRCRAHITSLVSGCCGSR